MTTEELSPAQVLRIQEVLKGTSNSVPGSPWLAVHPCDPKTLFENKVLLHKAITAGVMTSGALTIGSPFAALYSFDLVRQDGKSIDIDRHSLIASGATLLKESQIRKDFPEHHSSQVLDHYLKKE